MDINIGKWYKTPKGTVYRINFGATNPITGQYYLEVEMLKCILDYSKRSASTRFEAQEWFYQFYLDKQEKTEQDILNNAYVMCVLLNDTYNQSEKLDNKNDIEILKSKFNFRRESRMVRSSDVAAIRNSLNMEESLIVDIVNPY